MIFQYFCFAFDGNALMYTSGFYIWWLYKISSPTSIFLVNMISLIWKVRFYYNVVEKIYICTSSMNVNYIKFFWMIVFVHIHYNDIMSAMASQSQPHDCLFNRLFRRRWNKISKLRVTGLCVGNSPVTSEFPTQKASNVENVSIGRRHHHLELVTALASHHQQAQSWLHSQTCFFPRLFLIVLDTKFHN